MYLWNVWKLLFTQVGNMGSPSQYLIPLTALLGLGLQVLLLARCTGRGRWGLLAVTAGTALLMEVLLWVIHSYTALLFIIVMAYAMAALLGALLGLILYRLFRGGRTIS